MHVPEWLVTPFDMKIDNKGHESDIEDEHFEMHVNPILTIQRNRLNCRPVGFATKAHMFSTEFQQSCCCSSNTSIPLVPTILLQRYVNVAFILAILG